MTEIPEVPLKRVKKSPLVPDEATKIYEDDYNRLVKKQRKEIRKDKIELKKLFKKLIKTNDDFENLLELISLH